MSRGDGSELAFCRGATRGWKELEYFWRVILCQVFPNSFSLVRFIVATKLAVVARVMALIVLVRALQPPFSS